MSAKVSEKSLEDAIEQALLARAKAPAPGEGWPGGEPAAGYGGIWPGGYQKRRPEEYDPSRSSLRS